jgi:hypothetical protein
MDNLLIACLSLSKNHHPMALHHIHVQVPGFRVAAPVAAVFTFSAPLSCMGQIVAMKFLANASMFTRVIERMNPLNCIYLVLSNPRKN